MPTRTSAALMAWLSTVPTGCMPARADKKKLTRYDTRMIRIRCSGWTNEDRSRHRAAKRLERVLARATGRIVVEGQQQLREINETFRVGRTSQFSLMRLGIDLDSLDGCKHPVRATGRTER